MGFTPETNLGFGPVHFRQAQLRGTIGISVETFRHWKRILPPFVQSRRVTKFTLGDLLAAGILYRLTEECGIRVGALPAVSEAVSAICATYTWPALERKSLVINVAEATCRLEAADAIPSQRSISVVCPLSPVIAALRETLTRTQPADAQAALGFFPRVVVETRARRKRHDVVPNRATKIALELRHALIPVVVAEATTFMTKATS